MMKRYYKIVILILSIGLFYKFNCEKKLEKENIKNEIESIEYHINKIEGTYKEVKEKTIEKSNNKKTKNIINYKMIIEIPSINLKKGIFDKKDKRNNIEENVTILNESAYPGENNNIFIAAHSGNGNQSYFNDIDRIKNNDNVNIYYNNKKYTYLYHKKIEIPKKHYLV